MKTLHLAISAAIYLVFWCVFTYLLVFLGGPFFSYYLPIPEIVKTVGSGPVVGDIPLLPAVIGNTLLIVAFGLQHSIMARPAFKKIITKWVPQTLERSTFVLATCVVLVWFYLAWQPINTIVWQATGIASFLLQVSFFLGAGLVLWSTFLISHGQLFGIAQAWYAYKNKSLGEDSFITPSLYKISRHPMYFGILMVFWSTPEMTVGHFVAASMFSLYVFIGIGYEERDLLARFGSTYAEYMERVPQLLPIGVKRSVSAENAKPSVNVQHSQSPVSSR